MVRRVSCEGFAMSNLIAAIRTDKTVGAGSCSVIDECWTDTEIAAALADQGITTARKALQWAKALNKAFLGTGG